MKNFTDKLAVTVLSVFFVSYSFYQVSHFLHKPYETEIAYEYTMSDSYTGKGFFIRDEIEFPVEADDVIHFNYPNGAKVNKNDKLAECFDDENSAKIVAKIHDLENQVKNLKNISENFSVSYGTGDNLSQQVASNIVFMNEDIYREDLTNFARRKQDILNTLNKKEINSGRAENFDSRIMSLEKEIDYLRSTLKSEPTEIISPANGYFCSAGDGMSDTLSSSSFDKLTVDTCARIIENPPEIKDDRAKIITSCNWYFALNVPQEELQSFKPGRTVTVEFPLLNLDEIKATVYSVNIGENSDTAVIILKSNYILDKITTARVTEINIKFRTFTGYKVDADAVRFVDNVKGVYIIDDQQIKFRPIEVIYEDSGYIIISTEMKDAVTVRCFDEIIVEGVELYDGKPV